MRIERTGKDSTEDLFKIYKIKSFGRGGGGVFVRIIALLVHGTMSYFASLKKVIFSSGFLAFSLSFASFCFHVVLHSSAQRQILCGSLILCMFQHCKISDNRSLC